MCFKGFIKFYFRIVKKIPSVFYFFFSVQNFTKNKVEKNHISHFNETLVYLGLQ